MISSRFSTKKKKHTKPKKGHRPWPGSLHHVALESRDGTGLGGGSGQRPGTGDQTGRLGPWRIWVGHQENEPDNLLI